MTSAADVLTVNYTTNLMTHHTYESLAAASRIRACLLEPLKKSVILHVCEPQKHTDSPLED